MDKYECGGYAVNNTLPQKPTNMNVVKKNKQNNIHRSWDLRISFFHETISLMVQHI